MMDWYDGLIGVVHEFLRAGADHRRRSLWKVLNGCTTGPGHSTRYPWSPNVRWSTGKACPLHVVAQLQMKHWICLPFKGRAYRQHSLRTRFGNFDPNALELPERSLSTWSRVHCATRREHLDTGMEEGGSSQRSHANVIASECHGKPASCDRPWSEKRDLDALVGTEGRRRHSSHDSRDCPRRWASADISDMFWSCEFLAPAILWILSASLLPSYCRMGMEQAGEGGTPALRGPCSRTRQPEFWGRSWLPYIWESTSREDGWR